MKKNEVYYCERNEFGTTYGKADLSAPKLITDEDGDFNVYPTTAVILTDDCMYYEEGDDVEEPFEDSTLEHLNDKNATYIYRIDKQKFEEALQMALAWIKKHDELMAQYRAIKEEWK